MKTKENICSICGNEYLGFGHNAYPINQGRCCEICNDLVVKPARIRQLQTNATTN